MKKCIIANKVRTRAHVTPSGKGDNPLPMPPPLLPSSLYPFPGSASFWLEETTSTMDEARRLSSSSAFGLVMAGRQLAGRGRLEGRAWTSEAGQSLLATFWFPRAAFGSAPLPMVAGLAVARAVTAWAKEAGAGLASTCADGEREGLRLKWPNDVLLDGRKLAGILCEGSAQTIYAGIGVNCLQASFQGAYRTPPTSLLLSTGMAPEPRRLAALVAEAFEAIRAEPSGWKPSYEALLAWKGRAVRVKEGLGEAARTAYLAGVDESGALLLAAGPELTGPRAMASGEIGLLIDDTPEP